MKSIEFWHSHDFPTFSRFGYPVLSMENRTRLVIMKHVILPFFEYFISLKSIRPVTTGHESSSGVEAIMSYYLMPGTCHRHPFRSNTQTIDSKSLNAFSVHYTISDNDKAKKFSTKILAAALVWLYPQPEKWSYTVLQGALVFNLDKSDGARRTSFQVGRFGWK